MTDSTCVGMTPADADVVRRMRQTRLTFQLVLYLLVWLYVILRILYSRYLRRKTVVSMLDEALDEAVARPIDSYSLQLRVTMLRNNAKTVMYIGVLTSVLGFWFGPLIWYFSSSAARLKELRPNSLRRELRRLQIVALIVFLNAFFLALTMILMFGTQEFSAASHAEHNRVAQMGSWIILTFSNSWLLPSLIGEFNQGNLDADNFQLLAVASFWLSFVFNQFLLQWSVGGALTLLGGTNISLPPAFISAFWVQRPATNLGPPPHLPGKPHRVPYTHRHRVGQFHI